MGIYGHEEQSTYGLSMGTRIVRSDIETTIVHALTDRRFIIDAALRRLAQQTTALTEAALSLVETLQSGRKVLVVGNGGSAAEAQHFAAELVGRFKRERLPFAALALTADTALLTAIANDYGYHDVFSRQVQALGQADDLLLCFSTSGESENVLCAASMAQQQLMHVIAVTNDHDTSLELFANTTIRVDGIDTATTQELHMVVTHILCDIVESHLTTQQRWCSNGHSVKEMEG